MWLFNYCSAITSSIPTWIFRYFTIACQGTKYVCVWAQTCLGTNVHVSAQTWLWPHDYSISGHKCVWAQTYVHGHKRVWAQTCVGTNMCGHKRVWSQTCLGTNVSGHNRVGSSIIGHKRVVSVTDRCICKHNNNFLN